MGRKLNRKGETLIEALSAFLLISVTVLSMTSGVLTGGNIQKKLGVVREKRIESAGKTEDFLQGRVSLNGKGKMWAEYGSGEKTEGVKLDVFKNEKGEIQAFSREQEE